MALSQDGLGIDWPLERHGAWAARLRCPAIDALEFIAAIAWPLTVLVIALLFRRPILEILGSERGAFSAGPLGAQWDRTSSEIKSELQWSTGPPVAGGDGSAEVEAPTFEGSVVEELGPVAERAPAAAIVEAYARVEVALRELLGDDLSEDGDQLGAVGLANRARKLNLISRDLGEAVEGMATLRNLAAHGRAQDLSQDRAREYLSLADGVMFALRRTSR